MDHHLLTAIKSAAEDRISGDLTTQRERKSWKSFDLQTRINRIRNSASKHWWDNDMSRLSSVIKLTTFFSRFLQQHWKFTDELDGKFKAVQNQRHFPPIFSARTDIWQHLWYWFIAKVTTLFLARFSRKLPCTALQVTSFLCRVRN